MVKSQSLNLALWLAFASLMAGCAAQNSTPAAQPHEQQKKLSVVSLNAIGDFEGTSEQPQIWYVDEERGSLAVDAEKFKDQFAKVQATFSGESGDYSVQLTTLTETDGESHYKVSIDGIELALAKNPESNVDFAPHVHKWEDVNVKQGSLITIEFNSATNGKIPEGDTTAYARGRWVNLLFHSESLGRLGSSSMH